MLNRLADLFCYALGGALIACLAYLGLVGTLATALVIAQG